MAAEQAVPPQLPAPRAGPVPPGRPASMACPAEPVSAL
ncbi:hypothetical protein I547_5995 [Mycobacterium kansasii 824]|nr:hypothetical protein I547_5995 [Mycobacterium kansasii 824]